jgi:hypothetical protein
VQKQVVHYNLLNSDNTSVIESQGTMLPPRDHNSTTQYMTNSALDMQKTTTNITNNGFGRGSLTTEIIQGGTTVADKIY